MFIWSSSLTGCPVFYQKEGRREGRKKEGQIRLIPGSFLRMGLSLLLLSLVSFIWLNNGNTYWQANQDVRFYFCFKKYDLSQYNYNWDLNGWFWIFGYFKEQGEARDLYTNSGYSKWRQLFSQRNFVLGRWRNLVSKLFIPPCSFLASANTCAILFLLMDLDVKTMSTL